MFKRAKVVMLPTNEKSRLFKGGGSLHYIDSLVDEGEGWRTPQHLYFLSYEKIKEGDWSLEGNRVFKWTPFMHWSLPKIIATTAIICTGYNKEISQTFNDYQYLPQPSQPFIQKYIEEHNKGNIITDVMVEYEEIMDIEVKCKYPFGDIAKEVGTGNFKIKINPKDNTITITKVKDSWNREEVITLFDEWNNIVYKGYYVGKKDLETILDYSDKWIKENL